jgi:vancomycin aglycone glucosyltransferase
MRALLSTIGSRGDVQPIVALASRLNALGHEARLCVPPDFRDWIESLGMHVMPIGPELRPTGRAGASVSPPMLEQRRRMAEASVAAQFESLVASAEGCDIVLAATALQIAARSVAEYMGIPYVFAAFCPAVLPSPHHAPPVLGMLGDKSTPAAGDYAVLWARDAARFNDLFGAALNAKRASLGLSPVDDVRSHIFTDRPWLACDPVLGPWPDPTDAAVLRTGAWILPDERPLGAGLTAFLETGGPPLYFGFGSIRAPEGLDRVMVGSARALGCRMILSRGWADLSLPEDAPDCLAIDEVNHQALFRRVAAVVHHGGAGTTAAVARAGAPQVVIPQMYDQHYWAERVSALGIGVAHAPGAPTVESLASALRQALQPGIASRARSVAARLRDDGASAAVHLMAAAVSPGGAH